MICAMWQKPTSVCVPLPPDIMCVDENALFFGQTQQWTFADFPGFFYSTLSFASICLHTVVMLIANEVDAFCYFVSLQRSFSKILGEAAPLWRVG